jgi:hypothetical protein
MMSFRWQASWAKMTSPGGKLTALACHPTKKVNKAAELTHRHLRKIDRLIACLVCLISTVSGHSKKSQNFGTSSRDITTLKQLIRYL